MSKFTEVRKYVKENPNESVAVVASKFDVGKQFVYNARHREGVSVPAPKPQRSPKAGLKIVRKRTLIEKDKRIAELEKQIETLKTSPNQQVRYVATPDQVSAVRKLEQELVAAKAVISYLEGKFYGAPV